ASQLEKIDMLDFAEAVTINKFERRGAEDARRDVARQMVRNREAFGTPPEDMPVYGSSAATFNDDGVTALYQHLRDMLAERGLSVSAGTLPHVEGKVSTDAGMVIPNSRVRYLSEIAETVRGYHEHTRQQAEAVRTHEHYKATLDALESNNTDSSAVRELTSGAAAEIDSESVRLLETWPEIA